MDTMLILTLLLTLGAVVALYIVVLPKSKDGTFNNKFVQWLHDYFHFKKLYLESVLRFVFIVATIFIIIASFFALFDDYSDPLYCLLSMVLGPVVLRLSYEMAMMFILIVKNVMEINKKMGPSAKAPSAPPAAPKAPVAPTYAPPAPPTYAPPAAPTYAPPAPTYAPRPVAPAPRPVAPAPKPVAPAPVAPTYAPPTKQE